MRLGVDRTRELGTRALHDPCEWTDGFPCWRQDQGNRTAVNGRFSEVRSDECVCQVAQVCPLVRKLLPVLVDYRGWLDTFRSDMQLNRPVLCVQQVTKSPDRPLLMFRRGGVEVQRPSVDDGTETTAAESKQAALDGGDLVGEGAGRPRESERHAQSVVSAMKNVELARAAE